MRAYALSIDLSPRTFWLAEFNKTLVFQDVLSACISAHSDDCIYVDSLPFPVVGGETAGNAPTVGRGFGIVGLSGRSSVFPALE